MYRRVDRLTPADRPWKQQKRIRPQVSKIDVLARSARMIGRQRNHHRLFREQAELERLAPVEERLLRPVMRRSVQGATHLRDRAFDSIEGRESRGCVELGPSAFCLQILAFGGSMTVGRHGFISPNP
jgi:hypothetical protein